MKIEKPGGIRPGILLSSFSYLFKDLVRPQATRLSVLFLSPGGWEPGAPVHEQQVHRGSTVALFPGITFPYPISGHLLEVVAGYHRLCGFVLRGFIVVAGQTGPEARLANQLRYPFNVSLTQPPFVESHISHIPNFNLHSHSSS